MGDEHLDTTPSIENLVPIPSEFKGIFDDTCDVPNCVNVESDFVESLINRDTSMFYSSKIDPILEEFAGELAHIAPIPPGIVKADFDPNDDTSSDNDDFEDIEYVSLEEVNDVDQEEKEFNLEDIFQIQDVILREKLLNVHRLISNIESLKVNPTPNRVLNSPSPFPIPVADSDSFFEESDTSLSHLDNSLPEFETFSDHTKETSSGSTTTHANYSLPEYDLFLFEIEPDQEGLISIDNSNDPLLELPEFESFYFDEPSFLRPPPEPPDVEKCFEPEAGILITKVFKGVSKPRDFMADILPTLPTLVPDLTFISSFFSFGSEDTIFDPGHNDVSLLKGRGRGGSYRSRNMFATSCRRRGRCTDISEITIKTSKTRKTRYENGKSELKAGKPKAERKRRPGTGSILLRLRFFQAVKSWANGCI
ncbi:hypothetical protein Tco_1124050 [Tanacetum coccineum]|uniref:Reverse transcriptase domain-containing protein n=1 Tax=Tanacetum coccineum TaxID=301880 RepID=A0ABQ5J531_9ASTR